MILRLALPTAAILVCAGCGGDARPAAAAPAGAPVPAKLEGMPPATAPAAQPAAPAGTPVAAVDSSFARERDGWRVAFALTLPALSEPAAHRIRRAAEGWLFQGYEQKPGDVAAAGAAALDKLVIENPRPAGAGAAWYVERTVAGARVGPWLSLTRTLKEQAGPDAASTRSDALVIDAGTAQALTIDELVPADRQAALRAALAAALRAARGIPAGSPISSEVARDEDLPIPVPTLTAAGARFVWNPFEIGPAADGAYVAELPRDQVRGLLSADPWAK